MIQAKLVFNVGTQTASAETTVSYTVGPTAGNPIFDLRQVIQQAWVDGSAFNTSNMDHHDFGGGPFAKLRVIQTQQQAGSAHVLKLKYDLAVPPLDLGPDLGGN
ncbi:MAG TPA: hypothetical protein VGW58_11265, partial [Pyrinomonadaceae bacterium]|nr:hypothetical protein [Pyrinomonadaceae bacterium]